MATPIDDGEDWAHQHVVLFLANHLGRDPSSISAGERLADLTVDSLDLVTFVMSMEDEFGMDAPDEEFPRVETVQDLIDLVRKWRK